MHHSLCVAEIQQHVFSYCEEKSLAALARTCKMFQEAALDQLWSEIPLNSFLRLSPWMWGRGCLDTIVRGYPSSWACPRFPHTLTFVHQAQRGPIVASELRTLEMYAKRVKALSLNGLNPVFVDALRQLHTPIFPNLRTLWVFQVSNAESAFKFISCFLGPNIELIELCDVWRGQPAISLLFDIGRMCSSSLKVFKMRSYTHLPVDRDSMSEVKSTIISQLNELVHLEIDNLSSSAMTHIAASTNLRTLAIFDLRKEAIQGLLACGPVHFTQLSDLTLEFKGVNGVPAAESMLTIIHPCRLRRVVLKIQHHPPPRRQWRTLFKTLSLHHASTLQTLIVTESSPQRKSTRPAREIFRPLLSMRLLAHVEISGLHVTLQNDELEEMALAWPQLRVFSLATDPASPQVTPVGLVSLLKWCPGLERLKLAVDARFADFVSTEEIAQDVSNRKLTCVSFGMSPIDDSTDVANFLLGILPELRAIETDSVGIRGYQARAAARTYSLHWETVVTKILGLRYQRRLAISGSD